MVKQGPDFLKEVRHRLIDMEMTQVQLAKILGIKPSYLSDILLGNRDRHGTKYIPKIVSILGFDDRAKER